MYLVPDKKDINGIETIRINTLGNIILNIMFPVWKSGPNKERILFEKKKTKKQTRNAIDISTFNE